MRLIENGSRQYFLKLLETASATVRAKLESADPQAAAAIRDTIDDVATTMQHEVRNASDQYIAAMRDAKRRFNVRPFTESQHSRSRTCAGVRTDGDPWHRKNKDSEAQPH